MEIDVRKVATFVALTFAISWTTALALLLSPIGVGASVLRSSGRSSVWFTTGSLPIVE